MTPPYVPQIRLYQNWLAAERGLYFDSYDALWRWSVTDQEAFWQSLWDYDGMVSPTPHTVALADARMPGARWFEGAQVNYAQRVLSHVAPAHAAGFPAIVSENELGEVRELLSTGPQTVLVLAYEQDGKAQERMIPFVSAFVDKVELPEKRITVDWQPDY